MKPFMHLVAAAATVAFSTVLVAAPAAAAEAPDALVKRISLGNGPAAPAIRYRAVWRAPRTVPAAPVRFCITSYDPSGNRSRPACAPIRLRD